MRTGLRMNRETGFAKFRLAGRARRVNLVKMRLSGASKMPDAESGSPATRVRCKSSSSSLLGICFPADVDGGWLDGGGID
jgi:hypothetical protein